MKRTQKRKVRNVRKRSKRHEKKHSHTENENGKEEEEKIQCHYFNVKRKPLKTQWKRVEQNVFVLCKG